MVGMLKRAAREIGTNGKDGSDDKCARMVELVKW